MSETFALVVSMSAGGAVLIAALLLAERLAGRKTSRRWQYYIWLLVVARLLIPFGPDTSMFSDAHGTAAPSSAVQHHTVISSPDIPADTVQTAASAERDGTAQSDAPAAASDTEGTVRRPYPISAWEWTAVIWGVGAVALLVHRITVYQSFQRYVRAGMHLSDRTELLDIIAETGEKCGVRRPIELAVNPLVSSPLLIGLLHPCIVLPSEDISEDEFRYVAMHELTHLGRFDIVYKWAVQAAVCLHWFNPLVYLMSRRISRACEFSCDEAVVSRAGAGSAGPYAGALLGAMAAAGAYAEPVGQVQLSANAQMLKERITSMKQYGTNRMKGSIFVAVLLTACLAAGTACSGVYRTGVWGFPRTLPEVDRRDARTAAPVSDGAISIYADGCLLELADSADGTVYADYDSTYYDVVISHVSADPDTVTRVEINALRPVTGKERIALHVPFSSERTIELAADSSFVNWPCVSGSSVSADLISCYAHLKLDASFDGALSVHAPDSFVQLASDTDFSGMSVTLTGDAVMSPASFQQDGDARIFHDGNTATVSVAAPNGLIQAGRGSADWGAVAEGILGVLPEIAAELPGIVNEALPSSADAESSSAQSSQAPVASAEAPESSAEPTPTEPPSLRQSIRDGFRELADAVFGALSEELSSEVRESLHEAAQDAASDLHGIQP